MRALISNIIFECAAWRASQPRTLPGKNYSSAEPSAPRRTQGAVQHHTDYPISHEIPWVWQQLLEQGKANSSSSIQGDWPVTWLCRGHLIPFTGFGNSAASGSGAGSAAAACSSWGHDQSSLGRSSNPRTRPSPCNSSSSSRCSAHTLLLLHHLPSSSQRWAALPMPGLPHGSTAAAATTTAPTQSPDQALARPC